MWVYALFLTPKPECVIRCNEFLWTDIKHSTDSVFTLQWNARYMERLSPQGCAAAYIGWPPSHTNTHIHTNKNFKIHHILLIIFTRLLNWGQGVLGVCLCVCIFCIVQTADAYDFASSSMLTGNISLKLYLYLLSSRMQLSLNQFACESTFRTNCMYFFLCCQDW